MQHATFRRSVVSAAIALFAATQAHAEAVAAPSAGASGVQAQEVVIRASADASAGGLKAPYAGGQVARGGRVGLLGSQDVMDTPFAITNYTSKLIQDQGAASIADVLQNDPAVRVARGFGNFQQLYMVRGLPIYSDDMAYNGLYGLLPRQFLAAELVERVEVLRGASAFLNGAAPGGSGLGGAINIMPKRAPNAPMAEITLGHDDGQLSEALDVARRFGASRQLGLRANVVHREGNSDAVNGEKGKLDAALLGADLHVGDLRVSADFGSQNHQLTAVTPSITIAASLAIPRAPDAARQIAQPWTYSNERDTFGTLRAEYDMASNVTAWVAGGFRDGHEANNLTTVSVSDALGTDSILGFKNARKDSVKTGEAGLRGTFATGPVKHTVVASYGAFQSVSKNAYGFANFAGLPVGTIYATTFVPAPDETYFRGGKLDAPLTTLNVVTSSQALADTLSLFGDSVLLTVGGRRQKIEDTSFDYNSGAQSSQPNKASRITPVAGIVFKAGRQISLYATYIEGLVAGDIAPDNGTVSNGGVAFKPYRTRQGEIGVKVDTGRYGGTVSLFQSRKPGYAAVGGVFAQAIDQRNRGAELSVYGEAMPGLRVLGGASFLRTHVTGAAATGKHAIGAPTAQYNLGFDWDVPSVIGLVLDARVVHTSTQYADAANTQVVPAWSRFDIGGRYAIDIGSRVVTLRAGIDNLTNRNYWASAGGYPGAGYLVAGAPRTLSFSGTFAF
ncbi:MAG: TonB-dependent receptor [Burkholderiaceae bacterium]